MFQHLNTFAHRLLPTWLYEQAIGSWNPGGLKKYFANTGWMFIGRIITFLVSFLTIAFVSRYLGPENLGKLSYAQSYIAVISMFASLGIDQIVYRDLVAHPDREGEILGTAIVVKMFFGVLTFLVAVLVSFFASEELLITWLIAILACSFILQPFGVIGHVFNARVLSRYPTYVAIGIAFVIPLAKLLVIYFDQGVLFLAATITTEAALLSIAYIVLYRTVLRGSILNLRASFPTALLLARDSWPIMLVGVTGYLYARIDQIMLQHFLGPEAVGFYDPAVRLTEPLGFVPGVIMGSLFPAIINAKKTNLVEYYKRLRSLAYLCLGTSISLALALFFVAPWVIELLYGSEFTRSVSILQIYVWTNIGTVAMALMFNYFIAENRTYLQLIFTVFGAVLNIILNYLMIPIIGVTGAAYATLITTLSVLVLFLLIRRRV
jgi:O-antigen/teichoic acid export membrane protein